MNIQIKIAICDDEPIIVKLVKNYCLRILDEQRIAKQDSAVFKGAFIQVIARIISRIEEKYWGQHLWGRGYFCATVGSVTEETIRRYRESRKRWERCVKVEN